MHKTIKRFKENDLIPASAKWLYSATVSEAKETRNTSQRQEVKFSKVTYHYYEVYLDGPGTNTAQ